MADTPLTPHQAAGPVAVAVRLKDPEREAIARRNLAEAKIADAIDKALAAAPPLNNQQIHRLTGLLRAGGVR
ncbi:hypothetical protein GCM10009775_30540 [Microbacterium aoyamense]|uniref:CopG family transcriptional regulator n=2 Tax=Microbacterium TaxID=33882 RepID=A0A7D4TGA8_9MICO|nr:hypothetical protein [Microbacterium hominis]QKJ19181.1 hypothetical protein HQM25_07220 [Microbacterium hominis]